MQGDNALRRKGPRKVKVKDGEDRRKRKTDPKQGTKDKKFQECELNDR